MNIDIKKIKNYKLQFEFSEKNITSENYVNNLIEFLPNLELYKEYFEVIINLGGVHISNEMLSLGIYGFKGLIVASIYEGELLDKKNTFASLISVIVTAGIAFVSPSILKIRRI